MVMGRLFLQHLEGRAYSCRICKSHLALVDELVSKVSETLDGLASEMGCVDADVRNNLQVLPYCAKYKTHCDKCCAK